ncbi:MAG: TIGR03643 family protein [Bacteroidetes bacterium]|nr:TIGR03643 family protein [Bacteroidota bacterium]
MRKSKQVSLDPQQLERVVEMALEEKNPFDILKSTFNLSENEVIDILKKHLSKDKFDAWKKLTATKKPKPKPILPDDFDEEIGGKYYIPKGKI